MNNKPYIWMDDLGTWFTDGDYQNLDDLLKEGMFPLYTHPVKEEHFEDEPQAEELHEIMQSNTHPVEEQDESFDRTASHMAGEYVSYKPEPTDEEINEVIRIEASKDPAGIGWNLAFNVARAILLKAQEK